jgi:DNA-binding PadR family transcriptional regulator
MYYVLLGLADEPRHGLGIVRDVERRTGGGFALGPGLLYGSIKKLRRLRLIEDWSPRAAAEGDPRRRYYRITPTGLRAVRAESERLGRLVRTAVEKRLLRPEALA